MNIDVFDFDKTLYQKDSTIEFYLYCITKFPWILTCLPLQILYFILYKFKMVGKDKFKEIFFVFLRFIPDIDRVVIKFWTIQKKYINDWFLAIKSECIIVISASPEFLLKPICCELGINLLIATKVDPHTGKFLSKNCYGNEKVVRLKMELDCFTMDKFYSDSYSDLPLAHLSNKAFMVRNNVLVPWAEKENHYIALEENGLSKEFIRFLIVGIANVITGVFFAYVFSLQINSNIAFELGYFVSLISGYLLSSYYVFRKKLAFSLFLKYCISYIPNFAIQNGLLLFLFNYLKLGDLISFIISAGISVPITFIMLKLFAFKNK